MGAGRLRSYLEPVDVSQVRGRSESVADDSPPGAVGARYGSGCFHFCSRFSVSLIKSCRRVSDAASRSAAHASYPLLAWLGDGLVGLEQRANVHGLAPPEVPMDGPVQG
jgi:hypothetical protein